MTLAAIKIGGVMLGLGPLESVVVAAGITLAYSAAGGLTGVLLTDLVQFVIAVVGAAAAAVWLVNLPEVGGGWCSGCSRRRTSGMRPRPRSCST